MLLSVAPVPRETLQDHVYLRLKDLILTGEIEPGQSVTIQSIAQAFQVSNMPVREAFRRLVAEHALTIISGRSVGVPALSLERLEDLRRVRIEVEGLAAEWAAERLSSSNLPRLESLVSEMHAAIDANDVKSFLHCNRDFHFAVYAAAQSSTLASMIENLWLQVSPYFNLLHESGNYPRSNREHAQILSAIARRDGASARAAIAADIDGAAANLRSVLGQMRATDG
ncbi:MAG: GntR family transcriptional regulator [Hyphomicrobiaceae bacterium]